MVTFVYFEAYTINSHMCTHICIVIGGEQLYSILLDTHHGIVSFHALVARHGLTTPRWRGFVFLTALHAREISSDTVT